jgi:hypothetical protein
LWNEYSIEVVSPAATRIDKVVGSSAGKPHPNVSAAAVVLLLVVAIPTADQVVKFIKSFTSRESEGNGCPSRSKLGKEAASG